MLALTAGHRSSDQVMVKIAQAFMRQAYPLTDEGMAAKNEVAQALARNDVAWLRKNMPQLPIVENPRLDFFKELDFGELDERLVMGSRLGAIVSHVGCKHNCRNFCAANAPSRVTSRMPFPAALKIAKSKRTYDRFYQRLVRNWYHLIQDVGILEGEHKLDARIRSMSTYSEFWNFICEVMPMFYSHPLVDHLRLMPISKDIEFSYMWQHYGMFLPVLFESLQNEILTFEKSDPIYYWDPNFLHEDGTPADYGDLYHSLNSPVRYVFTSTAGYWRGDLLAKRSVAKVVDEAKDDPCFGGFRLTIKRYEAIARSDPKAYMENLKDNLALLAPLAESGKLRVLFYYDPRVKYDRRWATLRMKELDKHCREELGYSLKNITHYDEVSHYRGKAYDPRYAEEDRDYDSNWGFSILPNGSVTWRAPVYMVKAKDRKGRTQHVTESTMKDFADTGIRLW